MSKQYKLSYHENGVSKSLVVTAANEDEALNIGWSSLDVDDLYVSEVKE